MSPRTEHVEGNDLSYKTIRADSPDGKFSWIFDEVIMRIVCDFEALVIKRKLTMGMDFFEKPCLKAKIIPFVENDVEIELEYARQHSLILRWIYFYRGKCV